MMKQNKFVWIVVALLFAAAPAWLLLRSANPTTDHERQTLSTAARASTESAAGNASGLIDDDSKPSVRRSPNQEAGSTVDREESVGNFPQDSQPPSDSLSTWRKITKRQGSANHETEEVESASTASTSSSPASTGFRLAPNVKLPAAAMPVDFKMTPVAEKALQTIIDDYYRDLASGLVPELEAAANHPESELAKSLIEIGADGEKTIIVNNGKVAEGARLRADARFKILFGNAAFNRMTLRSALDSRLPNNGD